MTFRIFEPRITQIPRTFPAPRGKVAVFGQGTVGVKQLMGVTGCDGAMWIELAQDRVQWWALVLAVLSRCVLLPES
jgi:hypothetical protein